MSDWRWEYVPDAASVVSGLSLEQIAEVEAPAARLADAVGVRRIGSPFDLQEAVSGLKAYGEGSLLISTVAALQGLVYFQSGGNRFTDSGVQHLVSLTRLESLYLEEETLSAAAFDFAARLPHLGRLGLQDVALSTAELTELRQRPPSADVG